jgi:phage tail-like protein
MLNRRFAVEASDLPHYPAGDADELRLRPLHPLSMPALSRQATARLSVPFDSGEPGTVWHRIYLEAKLPPGTSVRVLLSAADAVEELPTHPDAAHGFGAISSDEPMPVGSWVNQASELPFHAGLLPCGPEPHRAGLFSVLVQAGGRRVRDLTGRYLDLSLELHGNGHLSPEVAAVRVYGPRFSYRDRYLPALYREELSGADARAEGDATGADFLNRLLGLCEGFLTPLEDRIANAYLLTNPATAPPEALDWLARWVGLALEPGLPEQRKRRMLRHAGSAYRRRGTVPGLQLALDLATDGKVGEGAIVVLEDFRLRRTFATILGADLSVEDDPLLQADLPSANSYVGDTLFLGDEWRREFMSLFAEELDLYRFEERAVERFHERLANRLTVLVHRDTGAEDLRLVSRIVEAEAPAHLVSRVLAAGEPLLVGLRSLVSVNTWLDEKPEADAARLGASLIGRKDQIRRTPSLDPRLDGGA